MPIPTDKPIKSVSYNGTNIPLYESDPVFTESPAYEITDADIANWDGKQDAISDLSTIRSNASAGAAKVSCTDATVGGFGYTKNTGTYSKPSTGIPKTDLASAVQTSLGRADTALQSFTETDPTVPSWAKQSSKPSYTASEVGAIPTSQIGAASGVAPLNSSSKIADTYLPSYVGKTSGSSSFTMGRDANGIYIDY